MLPGTAERLEKTGKSGDGAEHLPAEWIGWESWAE